MAVEAEADRYQWLSSPLGYRNILGIVYTLAMGDQFLPFFDGLDFPMYKGDQTPAGLNCRAGGMNFMYRLMTNGNDDEKADEEVLSVEEEREEDSSGGFRAPNSSVRRRLSAWECQTAQGERCVASEPNICGEIEGVHIGKIGSL